MLASAWIKKDHVTTERRISKNITLTKKIILEVGIMPGSKINIIFLLK